MTGFSIIVSVLHYEAEKSEEDPDHLQMKTSLSITNKQNGSIHVSHIIFETVFIFKLTKRGDGGYNNSKHFASKY